MNFSELPIRIQEELLESQKQLHIKWYENSDERICFTNEAGTRYFLANKVDSSIMANHKVWMIHYGVIGWKKVQNSKGGFGYKWVMSNKKFTKSPNGTSIYPVGNNKEDVLKLANEIGGLVMNK